MWEIYNTTGDTHPMHFHLVNVQVINRQLFNVTAYPALHFTGPVLPPDPNERGWKETVQMYPGTVTRVIMAFNLPRIVTAGGTNLKTPSSKRMKRFGLKNASEYVWHCHILEHEEHDMMRPLVVLGDQNDQDEQ